MKNRIGWVTVLLALMGCSHSPQPKELSLESQLVSAYNKKVNLLRIAAENMKIAESTPLVISGAELNKTYRECYLHQGQEKEDCVEKADQIFSTQVEKLYWSTDVRVILIKAQVVGKLGPGALLAGQLHFQPNDFQKENLSNYIIFELLARQTHNEFLDFKLKRILKRYETELAADLASEKTKRRSLASENGESKYLTLKDDFQESLEALKTTAPQEIE